jgi:hypothetical protein
MAQETVPARLTLKRPVLWACIVLLLAGVPVQVTGTGIDLFALLAAGALLFTLERTVGDAVAEFVGPVGAAVLFCAIAAIGFGYMLTDSGRGRAKRFFAAAEARGYQPLLFTEDRAPKDPPANGARAAAHENLTKENASPPSSPAADAKHADVRPAASEPSPPSPDAVPVSPGMFSSFGGQEIPFARLTASPQIVAAGETVNLQVRLIGRDAALRGPVVFFVNDREIGRSAPDANGVAGASTTPRVPGTYRAAVRLPSGTRATAPTPVSFTVVPPRR